MYLLVLFIYFIEQALFFEIYSLINTYMCIVNFEHIISIIVYSPCTSVFFFPQPTEFSQNSSHEYGMCSYFLENGDSTTEDRWLSLPISLFTYNSLAKGWVQGSTPCCQWNVDCLLSRLVKAHELLCVYGAMTCHSKKTAFHRTIPCVFFHIVLEISLEPWGWWNCLI